MVISHIGIRWYSDNPSTPYEAKNVLPILRKVTKIYDLEIASCQYGAAQVICFPCAGNDLVKLRLLQSSMIDRYKFDPTWVVLKSQETQFITWGERMAEVIQICAEADSRWRPVYLG